jgi:coenzyme F420-reducing hydrogenase alpha subunit
MHNKALALAKWGYEQAECKGYDCLTSQDWDDLKDCMEVAEKSIKCEYYHRIIEEMKSGEYRMTPETFKEYQHLEVGRAEQARMRYCENRTQENFSQYTKELVAELTEMWGTLDTASKAMIKGAVATLSQRMA